MWCVCGTEPQCALTDCWAKGAVPTILVPTAVSRQQTLVQSAADVDLLASGDASISALQANVDDEDDDAVSRAQWVVTCQSIVSLSTIRTSSECLDDDTFMSAVVVVHIYFSILPTYPENSQIFFSSLNVLKKKQMFPENSGIA